MKNDKMAKQHSAIHQEEQKNATATLIARIKENKISFLLLFCVLVLFVALPSFSKSASPYTIEGNKVYIDDSKVYISAQPHTLNTHGYVEFELISKAYSGDIDIAFGFDTSMAYPTSAELCLNEICNETRDVGSAFDKINYNYDDKDTWYVKKNFPVVAGESYKIRSYINLRRGYKGKYDVAVKPSSLTIHEAISQDKFYFLDPWLDGNTLTVNFWDDNQTYSFFSPSGNYTVNSMVVGKFDISPEGTQAANTQVYCSNDGACKPVTHTTKGLNVSSYYILKWNYNCYTTISQSIDVTFPNGSTQYYTFPTTGCVTNELHNFTLGNVTSNSSGEVQLTLERLSSSAYFFSKGLIFEYAGTAPIPPSITTNLISPVNQTNISTTSQNFVCNASLVSNATVTNLTFYMWNSTALYNYSINTTVLNASNETSWTISNIPDNTYDWNCYVYDSANNISDWGVNRTIMIDTTAPMINLIDPVDNTLYKNDTLYLNITYTEANPNTYLYSLDGGTNTSFTPNTTITPTRRISNITACMNDTSGNANCSATAEFYVGQIIRCNTSPLNQTSLNFTLKDEGNSSLVNGSVDLDVTYWISNISINTTYAYVTPSPNPHTDFDFCIYPKWSSITSNYVISFSADGYPQRSYSTTSLALSNTTINQNLYLLKTADGMYVRFVTIDAYSNSITGVSALMEKAMQSLGGTYVAIEKEITDSSGMATFWVNPDSTYKFTFAKTGYETQTLTIRPTSTEIYYITMGEGVDVDINESVWYGITYSISPFESLLSNDTSHTFWFNISSSTSSLSNYWMGIYNASDYLLGAASGTTITGGNLSVTTNIGAGDYVYGIYNFTVNNTIKEMTKIWKIEFYFEGNYSILVFFEDFKAMTVGGFDSFTRILIVFVVIFVITCILSYKVGIYSAKGIVGTVMVLVTLFSFVGFLEVESSVFPIAPAFMGQFYVAIVVILAGSAILLWKPMEEG